MNWGDWDGTGSRAEVALAILDWLAVILFCVFVVAVTLVAG